MLNTLLLLVALQLPALPPCGLECTAKPVKCLFIGEHGIYVCDPDEPVCINVQGAIPPSGRV